MPARKKITDTPDGPKPKRVMTPEQLEKLAAAREKAKAVKDAMKSVNDDQKIRILQAKMDAIKKTSQKKPEPPEPIPEEPEGVPEPEPPPAAAVASLNLNEEEPEPDMRMPEPPAHAHEPAPAKHGKAGKKGKKPVGALPWLLTWRERRAIPLLVPPPCPPSKHRFPPDAMLLADVMLRTLPAPLVPLPLLTITLPPRPPDADPEASVTIPLFPDFTDPVLKTRCPLVPVTPEFPL